RWSDTCAPSTARRQAQAGRKSRADPAVRPDRRPAHWHTLDLIYDSRHHRTIRGAATDMTTPTETEMITVFLLDDHEVVRRGVRDLLEAEPDITVVGEAATARG